jgi:MFS family permease
MAIGINTLSYGPHMTLIPRWFVRKKGLAAGLVLSGMGVGTMVMAPFIQFIIDTVGWRSAFLVTGGIVLGAVVPMTAVFQRRSPAEVGQFPDGIVPDSHATSIPQPNESPKVTRSPLLSDQWTLKAAIRTGTFWWIGVVYFCMGFILSMVVVHQAAHVVDAGYGVTIAALTVGLVGLLRSGGNIFFGLLSDRIGRELGYTLGSGAALVGFLFFLLVRDTTAPWKLYAFVILFGLGSGCTGPIIAAATADLFPGNYLGRIIGMFVIGFGVGGALGPYLGGYLYDRTGSYTFPFLLVMAIICLGILGIWMAGPRHRRLLTS